MKSIGNIEKETLPSPSMGKSYIFSVKKDIVQLLNVSSKRPKLFHSLIQSLDFTIMHWQEPPIVMEESCSKR